MLSTGARRHWRPQLPWRRQTWPRARRPRRQPTPPGGAHRRPPSPSRQTTQSPARQQASHPRTHTARQQPDRGRAPPVGCGHGHGGSDRRGVRRRRRLPKLAGVSTGSCGFSGRSTVACHSFSSSCSCRRCRTSAQLQRGALTRGSPNPRKAEASKLGGFSNSFPPGASADRACLMVGDDKACRGTSARDRRPTALCEPGARHCASYVGRRNVGWAGGQRISAVSPCAASPGRRTTSRRGRWCPPQRRADP